MAVEVVMPRLGWNMEVGSVVEWLKRDGDVVRAGEILLTVQTDKAINEVEAVASGILHIPPTSPAPGKEVPVGTVLAYLVPPGEAVPTAVATATAPDDRDGWLSGAAASATEPTAVAAAAAGRRNRPAISPRARRVAEELGVDWTVLPGSGRTGRIVERDVRAAALHQEAAVQAVLPAPSTVVRASSVARKLAEEAGVDLEQLARSRPGKRIRRADVEAVAREAPSAPVSGQAAPMSPVRRIIAERMIRSVHTAAPVTLTTEADATALVQLREEIKADLADTGLPVPSYTDLVAKLVAVALREHPGLNASLVDDAIIQHADVHVGIAVDTERGLLVPVIRNVPDKSVQQIAAESARLIEQARSGQVRPDDLQGGTFTITNLGMYDVDAFTPIINLPECAILGMGRIVARPVVVDEAAGQIAVRKMIALSLTFDHRIVDGAPAARFLQRVKQFIERPMLWLTR